MEQTAVHSCRYVERLKWDEWAPIGQLRERAARRVPVCALCGRERPARRTRSPVFIEVEAARATPPALPDAVARAVAGELLRRASRVNRRDIRTGGLLSGLAARGVPSSRAEPWLESFLHAGWLCITWRLRGARRTPSSVRVLDASALEEIARPGERARRERVLDDAKRCVTPLRHPIAQDVARLLASDSARTLSPDLVRTLAAVAVHVESGDVLPLRVVSTRHLGDSKVLGRLRRRVEALIGSLELLGIREGAALVMLGGTGTLRFGETELDLGRFIPFLGLTRETLNSVKEIEFPHGGLFVVENLTPFEACCRGEVAEARNTLVLWSAGYPGHGVRTVIEHAARSARPVAVWADLDLHGVRIARLVRKWVGDRSSVVSQRMAPEDLATARVWKRLRTAESDAIGNDLLEHGDAFLAEALRAMLEQDRCVEQEVFLGSSFA